MGENISKIILVVSVFDKDLGEGKDDYQKANVNVEFPIINNIYYDGKHELNEGNTIMLINGKQCPFKKIFSSPTPGKYEITLMFLEEVIYSNCKEMFYNCGYISKWIYLILIHRT